MSERMLKINEQLRKEIAMLISKEIPMENGLITIIHAKTSADIKNTTLLISVIPENLSGSALKLLRKQSSTFRHELKKRLNLKYIPKLNWKIDPNERYALEMDKVFKEAREINN